MFCQFYFLKGPVQWEGFVIMSGALRGGQGLPPSSPKSHLVVFCVLAHPHKVKTCIRTEI